MSALETILTDLCLYWLRLLVGLIEALVKDPSFKASMERAMSVAILVVVLVVVSCSSFVAYYLWKWRRKRRLRAASPASSEQG
jgi:hypothetical protein